MTVCCIVCAAVPTEASANPSNGAPAAVARTSPAHKQIQVKNTAKSKPPVHRKAKSPASANVPDAYKLNLLIRTTIVAVSQANKTGNYSVLRDLGSPNFQTANSEAKLTEIFAGQRNANIDLSPVLFFKPKLIRKPEIDTNGMLRLTGFFATQPNQVDFDLAFERVQGEWRYFGLSVGTQHAAPNSASEHH